MEALKRMHTLPNIDEIFSRLPKANIISKIDLKVAYWQVPLEQTLRSIKALTVP